METSQDLFEALETNEEVEASSSIEDQHGSGGETADATAARLDQRRSRSASSGVIKQTRSESSVKQPSEEQGDAESSLSLHGQHLLDTVAAIVKVGHLICPRCEHFFLKPFQQKDSLPSSAPPHPSLLGSCVLCNRCDGFLVKRQGSPSNAVDGWSGSAGSSATAPSERYDQSAGVHWVHPYCAEWFVPPKLKGSGVRHVGRVLKKYGSRPGAWQDTSIVATSVAMSRPEPSLTCYICGFSTGALWTCSHPKCSQA